MNQELLSTTSPAAVLLGQDSPGSFDFVQMLVVAGVILVTTLVLRSTARRLRRTKTETAAPVRQRYAQLDVQQKATRDLESVMLELDQLSRQIHGRIDTKLARLDALIRDADQRIARLTHLSEMVQDQPEPAPQLEVTLQAEDPAAHFDQEPDPKDNRHAEVFRLADAGLPAEKIAQQLGQLVGEVELIVALRKTKSAASAAGVSISSSSRPSTTD